VKRIPISAAKWIAEQYGYDQIVVIGRKVGEGEHCTTYGATKAHCDVAARMGNFLKFKRKIIYPSPFCIYPAVAISFEQSNHDSSPLVLLTCLYI